jgi:serine/threonine protein kinase
MRKSELCGKIIFNKYLVGSCIGSGSFGDVYLVYDIEREEVYAMKAVLSIIIDRKKKRQRIHSFWQKLALSNN